MKKRILAIMAVLAGAAAGTAVTAVNYQLYRKAKEAEKDERQNLTTASELYERANVAQEQSYLLQKDMFDFAELADWDKEKVRTLVRKLAKKEKDNDTIKDKFFFETAPPLFPWETKSEDEKEKEKLMEEYWRRAKNVYGHGDAAYALAKNAKPVYYCNTSHAYISVAEAARKTGRSASYIRECCNTPSLMAKESLSASKNGGGVFCYMSQTEYASIPENRIEVVETREKKDDDDDFSDDITPATKQAKTESEYVAPQASGEDDREKLVAEYLRRVESVYGQGKEARMMAASARPVRNTRTGYVYIGIIDASKKTGGSASDIYHSCMSNNMRGDEWCYITQREYAKMPKEKVEVEIKEEEKDNDTTHVTPQAKSESDTPQATTEDEEEKLMAEYRRRAEKVYGRNDATHGALEQAKPIRNSQTGYAYIRISDAARKTGYSASYIHNCCKMKTIEQLTKMLSSDKQKGGVFYYISQTEYAKTPEEMTEVETKNQKTEIEKLMEEYWRRAKKVYGCDNRSLVGVQLAKPVCNSRTGYAYISASDAAIKTGTDGAYIYQSCASNNSKVDEWRYITKVEYAKFPEEMTEVETWDQRTKEETK